MAPEGGPAERVAQGHPPPRGTTIRVMPSRTSNDTRPELARLLLLLAVLFVAYLVILIISASREDDDPVGNDAAATILAWPEA